MSPAREDRHTRPPPFHLDLTNSPHATTNQPHTRSTSTRQHQRIRTSRARTSTTLPSIITSSSSSSQNLSCRVYSFSASQQYQHIIDITDLRGGEVECPISMLCYCTTGRGGARMSGHELVCTKYVRCTWIVSIVYNIT